jgi:hypothetical protein
MPLIANAHDRYKRMQAYLNESVSAAPAVTMLQRQARFLHVFMLHELEACRAPKTDTWHAVHLHPDSRAGTVLRLVGLEITSGDAFDVYPLVQSGTAKGGLRYATWMENMGLKGNAEQWSNLFVFDYTSRRFRCLEAIYLFTVRKCIRQRRRDEICEWIEAMAAYCTIEPVCGSASAAAAASGPSRLNTGQIGVNEMTLPSKHVEKYRQALERALTEDYEAEQIPRDLAPPQQIPAANSSNSSKSQYRIPPPNMAIQFGSNVAVCVYKQLLFETRPSDWDTLLAHAKHRRFVLVGALKLDCVKEHLPQNTSWNDTNRINAAEAFVNYLFKEILEQSDNVEWVDLCIKRNSIVVQLDPSSCSVDDVKRIEDAGRRAHSYNSPYNWKCMGPAPYESSQSISRASPSSGPLSFPSPMPSPCLSPSSSLEDEMKDVCEQVQVARPEAPVLDLPAHYMSVKVRNGKATDVNTDLIDTQQVHTAQTAPYRVLVCGIHSYKAPNDDNSVGMSEDVHERQADAAHILALVRSLIPPMHFQDLLFVMRNPDMTVELGFSRMCSAASVREIDPIRIIPCTRLPVA